MVAQTNADAPVNIGSLTRTIEHRGPDDYGWLTWSDGQVARGRDDKQVCGKVVFGHRRLSIIDLSQHGWQPMSTQDNRYHIAYNGEPLGFSQWLTVW